MNKQNNTSPSYSMQKITATYGFLLILLGVISYLLSNRVSITALIPTFFGLPVLLLAILACKLSMRKHAIHAVVLLALLGLFGSVKGLSKLPALISGAVLERPGAVLAQSIMAILSLVFVALAVRSFIKARK